MKLNNLTHRLAATVLTLAFVCTVFSSCSRKHGCPGQITSIDQYEEVVHQQDICKDEYL